MRASVSHQSLAVIRGLNMTIGRRSIHQPFRLLRWFAVLSPAVILLIALGNAWLISNFLNSHLFERDALVTRDFMQNILVSDGSIEYLANPDDPRLARRFAESINHLSHLPDVLRANLYNRDHRVLWSTDSALIGQVFPDNDELDDAIDGKLVVEAGAIDEKAKSEYIGLDPAARFFIESYIPLRRPNTGEVLGVIELYKASVPLSEAIFEARSKVGMAALLSAILLYVGLFGVVQRADRLIKQQHQQLREADQQALIGELTSAVAHNIRNPLSSIRSAAELIQAFPAEDTGENAATIVGEVDRISERVTEMLRLSQTPSINITRLDLVSLLREWVDERALQFSHRAQSLSLDTELGKAWVDADSLLLRQVLYSVLSNASEAMPNGGVCRVALIEAGRDTYCIDVRDSGPGMSPEAREQAFRPFFTTKPKGLGLGLPMARRLMDRLGGQIGLFELPEGGTSVQLILPKVVA